MQKHVLVAVLKSPYDLSTLLRKKWYRIPLAFLPKRRFSHVAFYEPKTGFGTHGGRIRYYARVSKREVKKRIELLPDARVHPRAHDDYLKCSFRTIERLDKPIRNIIPRRVSFGFTDLKTLRAARDILELYGVPPTEQLIEQRLKQIGIPFISQYRISFNSPFVKGSGASSRQGISSPPISPILGGTALKGVTRRGLRGGYRLDIAILCRRGNTAIECDNRKAHASKTQRQKDTHKDAALRRLGWRVIRLTERDILEHLDFCISRIQKVVHSLGGIPLRNCLKTYRNPKPRQIRGKNGADEEGVPRYSDRG